FANYAVVQGADKFMPIDLHVPGCPPRPEAVMYGFNKLQRKIMGNPDQGWRARYNAAGTEEWARGGPASQPSVEAAEAAVLATSYEKERAALIVDASRIREVLSWLRDTPGQGYSFLSSLHVAD